MSQSGSTVSRFSRLLPSSDTALDSVGGRIGGSEWEHSRTLHTSTVSKIDDENGWMDASVCSIRRKTKRRAKNGYRQDPLAKGYRGIPSLSQGRVSESQRSTSPLKSQK
jgi:hypothetical protein